MTAGLLKPDVLSLSNEPGTPEDRVLDKRSSSSVVRDDLLVDALPVEVREPMRSRSFLEASVEVAMVS